MGNPPEPLLVVHGLRDSALTWRRFAAAMAPGREPVTFDLPGPLDGGHFLHRERPDQLAEAISEFLAEPPRSEAG